MKKEEMKIEREIIDGNYMYQIRIGDYSTNIRKGDNIEKDEISKILLAEDTEFVSGSIFGRQLQLNRGRFKTFRYGTGEELWPVRFDDLTLDELKIEILKRIREIKEWEKTIPQKESITFEIEL